MPEMKSYQHTQTANWILLLFVTIAAVVLGFVLLHLRAAQYAALIPVPILVGIGLMFRSLTIEITEDELRWSFGGGWFRKRVPLAEIVSVKAVRTTVFEGWGIHYSRYGWLYNLSGFDAVAITLKTGKQFCLGTDQPHELAARLKDISAPPVMS
jgi:hypothetical protein